MKTVSNQNSLLESLQGKSLHSSSSSNNQESGHIGANDNDKHEAQHTAQVTRKNAQSTIYDADYLDQLTRQQYAELKQKCHDKIAALIKDTTITQDYQFYDQKEYGYGDIVHFLDIGISPAKIPELTGYSLEEVLLVQEFEKQLAEKTGQLIAEGKVSQIYQLDDDPCYKMKFKRITETPVMKQQNKYISRLSFPTNETEINKIRDNKFNYYTIVDLHNSGKTVKEIQQLTNYSINDIKVALSYAQQKMTEYRHEQWVQYKAQADALLSKSNNTK